MRAPVAFVLFVLVATVRAAPYEDEVLRFEPPAGFQGPHTQAIDRNSLGITFRKPHSGDRGTVLLISMHDFGARLAGKIPPGKLGEAADKYLLDFLAGVERARASYQATKPERIMLGGLPAARAKWSGIAQGHQMSGTMYCVIAGTRVVNFHAQDFDDGPPANMAETIRAIEAVTFKRTGN